MQRPSGPGSERAKVPQVEGNPNQKARCRAPRRRRPLAHRVGAEYPGAPRTTTLAAERIRRHRLELGLPEREVAAHWDVSTAFVRRVEARRVDSDLTLGQLNKLASILALDVDDPLESPAPPTEQEARRGRRSDGRSPR